MGQVELARQGDVAVITIVSAGRLNAFTRAMRASIAAHLDAVAADQSAVGAVLTGAGNAFCAGQDLNESQHWTAETPWVEEFEQLFRTMLRFAKPLVAAVNGVAAGGGFQVALMCDSRIAHPAVRMGQTEVRWGLASVTGTWLLERSVGAIKARQLVLSGRLMEAEELLHLGLVDAIVPAAAVLSAAIAACRGIAANPADSLARTKTWLYESISEEMSAVFRDARRLHSQGFASGVSQAGSRGFLARRRPAADR